MYEMLAAPGHGDSSHPAVPDSQGLHEILGREAVRARAPQEMFGKRGTSCLRAGLHLTCMWAEAGFPEQPFTWEVPPTVLVCALATLRQMAVGMGHWVSFSCPRDGLRVP